MHQRNWNNIPDLLRTMSVKVSVKDGKISNLNFALPIIMFNAWLLLIAKFDH